MSSTFVMETCEYCGGFHNGFCPRVKSVEYDEFGQVRKIEFHPNHAAPTVPVTHLESCVQNGDDYFWNGSKVPRDAVGRCKEYNQYRTVGHLARCSYSFMQGGPE